MCARDDSLCTLAWDRGDDRVLSISMLEDRDRDRRLLGDVSAYLRKEPLSGSVIRFGLKEVIIEAAKHVKVSLHVCTVQLRIELLHGRIFDQICRVCMRKLPNG
jgi:hypothetical protein